MKRLTIYLLALAALAACERGQVEAPTFDVSVASTVVKAGTSVDFAITGYSDILSFYSGESGNEYSHRLEDRIMENAMYIVFGTIQNNGSNPNHIQLMWSSDFRGTPGAYTREDIEAATWHDISDRFNWPKEVSELIIPAGEVDITGLFEDEEHPIYLMFFYNPKAGEGLCSYFNIQGFHIQGVTPIGSEEVYSFLDCGWEAVYEGYVDGNLLPDNNGKRLLMRGSNKTKAVSTDHFTWFVGGPFFKSESLNMGPDRAVAIKANSDPMLSLYQYVFETPGDYTVTFVGRNASVYGHKEVVREIRLTVVDDAGSVVSPSEGVWND